MSLLNQWNDSSGSRRLKFKQRRGSLSWWCHLPKFSGTLASTFQKEKNEIYRSCSLKLFRNILVDNNFPQTCKLVWNILLHLFLAHKSFTKAWLFTLREVHNSPTSDININEQWHKQFTCKVVLVSKFTWVKIPQLPNT